jgi:hypothetical protein
MHTSHMFMYVDIKCTSMLIRSQAGGNLISQLQQSLMLLSSQWLIDVHLQVWILIKISGSYVWISLANHLSRDSLKLPRCHTQVPNALWVFYLITEVTMLRASWSVSYPLNLIENSFHDKEKNPVKSNSIIFNVPSLCTIDDAVMSHQ